MIDGLSALLKEGLLGTTKLVYNTSRTLMQLYFHVEDEVHIAQFITGHSITKVCTILCHFVDVHR